MYDDGFRECMSEDAALYEALTAAGRADELLPALEDMNRRLKLLREFGIIKEPDDEKAAEAPDQQ